MAKGSSSIGPVKRLQLALQGVGFYTGKIDGDYGALTCAAVEPFQRAQGLSVDAVAGEMTQRAMHLID